MPSPIDDIKSRLDIVELVQSYLRLQKAGANWKALCPFHAEKTPSFNVSPTRQIWHCFGGCNEGGDIFTFIMKIEGIEFPEALELLARRAGVQVRREDPRLRSERSRLSELIEEAAKLYEAVLRAVEKPGIRVSPVLAYLKRRGLADETIETWRIGYAPDSWDFLVRALSQKGYRPEEIEKAGLAVRSEQGSWYDRFRNRIVFPIADATGRVVGFSGRIFDSNPQPATSNQQPETESRKQEATPAKYINTPQTLIYDKSRVLYGFSRAKETIRRENAVVLVEGQMDVVLSHQAGVENAVAVSGTALTGEQLKTLKRLCDTIVSSFDRDAAGEAATKRSLDLAAAYGFDRKVAILPGGLKDPAEAVARDAAIWQRAVAEAKPIVEFFLETALAKHDRATAAGKRLIAAATLPEVRRLASEIEKAHWIQELARAIGVEETALWRELRKAKPAAEVLAPRPDEAVIPPDRRTQLEALVVGALILHPERAAFIANVPRHAFSNDEHRQILTAIERALDGGPGGPQDLLAALPPDLHETCNRLAFQAEVVLERIENAAERAREITVCMQSLEREWARAELQALERAIARAEAQGNTEELGALLERFRALSAKMA